MNKKDKEIKKTNKVLSFLRTFKNVVCWTLIAILAIVVIIAMYSRINGNTPSFFGYSILRISSGSMEPDLKIGDVILSQNINDVYTLRVGDVITYEGSGDTSGKLVTHEVIVAPHKGENGSVVLQTKGIANDVADREIVAEQVVSKMVVKLQFIDTMYNLFLSPWGLLIFIALILLIFFDEIINIVKIASGHYDEEEPEDINEIIKRIQEEERERQIEKLKLQHADKVLENKHPDDDLLADITVDEEPADSSNNSNKSSKHIKSKTKSRHFK